MVAVTYDASSLPCVMLLSYITQLLYEYLLSTYLLCSRHSARLWSYVDEQNCVFSTVPCVGLGGFSGYWMSQK